MKAIGALPRASCFGEEALQLIETLMIVAPVAEIPFNMNCIQNIISRYYGGLKKYVR